MLVDERPGKIERGAASGVDVERPCDAVDRAIDLGNVALEAERHARSGCRVFEFRGFIESCARALIIDLDGKTLEKLVADQTRDIVETLDAAREIAQVERREYLRFDDDATD